MLEKLPNYVPPMNQPNIVLTDMADMYLGRREQLETEDLQHRGYELEERLQVEAPKKGPRELRTAHPHDIEDCENLLENFFMQVLVLLDHRHRRQLSFVAANVASSMADCQSSQVARSVLQMLH